MSFHSHTSHRWSERWYIALFCLPAIFWAVMTFGTNTIFTVALFAAIGFYLFARKRFHQSGNRIRSKEKAILAAGICLLASSMLAHSDYVDNGIAMSADDLLFVIEMTLLVGTYALTFLSAFLPEGIYEALENKVDTGKGNVNTFIGG